MTLWLIRPPHGFKSYERINLDTFPCPTILASGDPGAFAYYLEEDGLTMPVSLREKPPYQVPSMAAIAQIPWNGQTVVSTFSGCGGSCLGYRMAGFKVIWANEFVPIVQQSYRANAASESLLDGRDIRQVTAADILQETHLNVGDIDILDGSPPCQAFSMAGKRHKGWGKDKSYEHGARQKNETLFTDYIRLARDLQPKVFVAENVSGLIKGVAKGYFKEILTGLKGCGYVVEARLLDAQWLGVPQMRQRIIFVGVRKDLQKMPVFPLPLSYRYSVREALPGIQTVIHDTGGFVRNKEVTDGPCPSVTVGVNSLNSLHYHVIHDESGQWSQGRIDDQPEPTVRSVRQGSLWIEGANGFNSHAVQSLDSPMPTVQAGRPVHDMHGTAYQPVAPSPRRGHGFHAQDVILDSPCNTVTIASPGNDLCVPSPIGRRKFTIAEVKRICAFPDDFVLKGTYAQQWACLGNSVPPVMMYWIAKTIAEQIFVKPS